MLKKPLILLSVFLTITFLGCSSAPEETKKQESNVTKVSGIKETFVINSEKEDPILTLRTMAKSIDNNETLRDFKKAVGAFYILIEGNALDFSKLDGNTTADIVRLKNKMVSDVNNKFDDLHKKVKEFKLVLITDSELSFMQDSLNRKRAIYHGIIVNNTEKDVYVTKIFVTLYDPEKHDIIGEALIRHRDSKPIAPGETREFEYITKSTSDLALKASDNPWHRYMYSYILKTYGEQGVQYEINESDYDEVNVITRKIEDMVFLDSIVLHKLGEHIIKKQFTGKFEKATIIEQNLNPEDKF